MWPFSYSRWATCIAYLAEKPSLRDASCCSVVVRNGAYGDLRYGLRSTEPARRGARAARRARGGGAAGRPPPRGGGGALPPVQVQDVRGLQLPGGPEVP